MKKLFLAASALVASCALAGTYTHTTYTGGDTNLKTIAVVADGKFVLGTGDYSDSEWDSTKERIYDGFTELPNGENIDYRWFEPGWVHGPSDCNWAGYQTQSPVVVTHISFITRHDDYASRARGCRFEGANKADFSDAVALYTVPADADIETLKAGWVEVDITGAALSSPFTYLRVVADDEFCGNFIEVEFYGKTWSDATSEAPSAAPQNFTAASAGDDADTVTLSWDLPTFSCMSTRVFRATAPGGPFTTAVATLPSATASCTDSLARTPGVAYYYCARFLNVKDASELAGPVSATQEHRHCAEIVYDWTTMTPIAQAEWNADGASRAFDNDTTTFPDLNASTDDLKKLFKVGVDLGAEYVSTSFKVYPRTNNSLGARANGAYLAGSSDASDMANLSWAANPVALSDELTGIAASEETWYTFSTTNHTPCRFVYLMKPTSPDFYGNVAELKLYGYPLSNVASVLLAPENAAAEWHGTRAVITWTASPNAASYKVERSADGGATWVVLADGIANETTTYTDRPTKATSISYIYRVASVAARNDNHSPLKENYNENKSPTVRIDGCNSAFAVRRLADFA